MNTPPPNPSAIARGIDAYTSGMTIALDGFTIGLVTTGVSFAVGPGGNAAVGLTLRTDDGDMEVLATPAEGRAVADAILHACSEAATERRAGMDA